MGETKIQWAHYSFNIVWGCTKVSAGCEKCYSEAFSRRLGKNIWGLHAERQVMSDAYWQQPLKWNRQADAAGVRRRVFCSSMADVFEDHPTVAGQRVLLWNLIRETPMLDWLLLTKRPENIRRMVPEGWGYGFPENVWMGTTTENQATAGSRIEYFKTLPSVVAFLSVEPLLERVSLNLDPVDWVIVGGESGPGAREMKREWAEDIIAQCDAASVPVFFKQTGSVLAKQLGLRDKKGGDFDELPESLKRREWPLIAL